MSFALTPEQLEIRDAVARLCERFGDEYWLQKDTDGGFPHEFHRAMADVGWLGVAMPEAYGGSGLGITEAAVVMQAVAQSGAGFSGASAVHMNIFGLNPVVVFGTDECIGDHARSLPEVADHSDPDVFGQLMLPEPEFPERYVVCGRSVPGVPLVRLAHIEKPERAGLDERNGFARRNRLPWLVRHSAATASAAGAFDLAASTFLSCLTISFSPRRKSA